MSDGSGTVTLHPLDNPSNPLRDQASPTSTFLYNPCSPITNPDCKGNSLCEEQGDFLVPLGMFGTAVFIYNYNQLIIQYIPPHGNNNASYVRLICDPNQREEPFF